MPIYTAEFLAQKIADHGKWLRSEEGGKRLVIDEYRADLRNADLRNADLRNADLRNAVLRNAVLSGADLSGADLRNADLRNAVLSGAVLRNAVLSGADLSGFNWAVCPEEGAFIGWKKVRGDIILKLEILSDARRVSTPLGRKCRAEKVRVLEAKLASGREITATKFRSGYDSAFYYELGAVAEVPDFDDSIVDECTRGIHFFITRKEAVEYSL